MRLGRFGRALGYLPLPELAQQAITRVISDYQSLLSIDIALNRHGRLAGHSIDITIDMNSRVMSAFPTQSQPSREKQVPRGVQNGTARARPRALVAKRRGDAARASPAAERRVAAAAGSPRGLALAPCHETTGRSPRGLALAPSHETAVRAEAGVAAARSVAAARGVAAAKRDGHARFASCVTVTRRSLVEQSAQQGNDPPIRRFGAAVVLARRAARERGGPVGGGGGDGEPSLQQRRAC